MGDQAGAYDPGKAQKAFLIRAAAALVPLPREHGAWVVWAAAWLAPLYWAGGAYGWPGAAGMGGYLCLVVWSFTVLAAGEAECRRRRSRMPGDRQRLQRIVRMEQGVIAATAGAAALLVVPVLALGAGAVAVPYLQAGLRQRGFYRHFGGEAAAVCLLTFLLPLGAWMLGVTEPAVLLSAALLFALYHLGGMIHVRASMVTNRNHTADAFERSSQGWIRSSLLYQAALMTVGTLGWQLGWWTGAVPAVFAASMVRSLWVLKPQREPLELRQLGRREAVGSILFILVLPWLVPLA